MPCARLISRWTRSCVARRHDHSVVWRARIFVTEGVPRQCNFDILYMYVCMNHTEGELSCLYDHAAVLVCPQCRESGRLVIVASDDSGIPTLCIVLPVNPSFSNIKLFPNYSVR